MPSRVSPELAATEVLDAAGAAVRLDSVWHARPALLIFLRHFG
ncbi:MAG: hypothetical protein ACYC6M_12695 [Terriglobales bacterium]